MRVLQFILTRDIRHETRLLKDVHWLKKRGFDDIGIVTGFYDSDRRVVCWYAGQIDGVPVLKLNSGAASHARELILRLKPDVVHVHELDALWALLSVWEGDQFVGVDKPKDLRVIFEAHEYEPGRNMPDATPEQRQDRIDKYHQLVPLVDDMIVVSPSIRLQTREDLGIVPELIPNVPIATIDPVEREEGRVVFCGNVTRGRGLDVVCSAMHQLDGYQLELVGDTRITDEELVQELADVGASFAGLKKPNELLGHLTGACAGIDLVDSRVESYRMALPNKFFEYAFAGVPVVANSQEDVRWLIGEYSLGTWVDVSGHNVEESGQVADAIRKASTVEPRTADFVQEWGWEATGGCALDYLYGVEE